MKVLKPKIKDTYDVFVGAGWNNWSRYKFTPRFFHHIAGKKLPRAVVEKVRASLFNQ